MHKKKSHVTLNERDIINENINQCEYVSKTKKKEQMQLLQDLGVKLVSLSKAKLDKFELPDTLKEAINLAKNINAHGALKRQYQYIGKLMRDINPHQIQNKLDEINGTSKHATKILHLCEKWRERLLNDHMAHEEFIHLYPDCDLDELQSLIRIVNKEPDSKDNKNFRKLFIFIKKLIEKGV